MHVIDLAAWRAADLGVHEHDYTERELALYALGVGALLDVMRSDECCRCPHRMRRANSQRAGISLQGRKPQPRLGCIAGCKAGDLRHVYERHPSFLALPTFALASVLPSTWLIPLADILPRYNPVNQWFSRNYSCTAAYARIAFSSNLRHRWNAGCASNLCVPGTTVAAVAHLVEAQLCFTCTQRRLLHGEQFLQVLGPTPARGGLRHRPHLVG